MNKGQMLRSLLKPYGFKRYGGAYVRNYKNEFVQVISLSRERSMRTYLEADVYSIYDENILCWMEAPKFFPIPHSVENYAGLKIGRSRVPDSSELMKLAEKGASLIFDGKWKTFYDPTDEEQFKFLTEFTLPQFCILDSQADLLDLYHIIDLAEYGNDYLLGTMRIYPALASGNYCVVDTIVENILKQNRDVEERRKNVLPPDEYAAYCKSGAERRAPLLKIKALLEDEEAVKRFLAATKERNLAALPKAVFPESE